MEIINGIETEVEPYIVDPSVLWDVDAYTDDYSVNSNQTGHTLTMSSTSNKTFTLPAATAAIVGVWFTFSNINTGRLTVAVSGTGVQIHNGTAASGTIYCDDDYIATITLQLVSTTKWSVVGATGLWVTT